MTDFKKGDRVRWTGKSPLGSRGKTFADNEPEKVGRLGTIEGLIGTRTARVAFDNGQISTGTFFTNLELVEPFPIGARFVFNHPGEPNNRWNGRSGTVVGLSGTTQRCVWLDGEDNCDKIASIKYMTSEPQKETNIVANFKNIVKSTLDTLLAVAAGESAKDQAVRRLGIASALASRAESEKKAAKTKLKELGVIRDDEQAGTVFDSERYTVEAKVKAPSTRLDQAKLEQALLGEGLSGAMRARILASSLVTSKAPVSYIVEAK